jgi:hypothetical protein
VRLSAPSGRDAAQPPGPRRALTDSAAHAAAERTLLRLLTIYALASLAHFAHNALELNHYPHMPPWLTASAVMAAWLALSALGLCGYWLYRRGSDTAGLALIVLYGLCGLDALAHYLVAPFAAHGAAMHASILGEALAGVALAAGALLYRPVLMRVQARVRSRA